MISNKNSKRNQQNTKSKQIVDNREKHHNDDTEVQGKTQGCLNAGPKAGGTPECLDDCPEAGVTPECLTLARRQGEHRSV